MPVKRKGATAVPVGTANFIDPRTAVQVAEGIKNYLTAKKLAGINDLRGKLVKTVER